MKPKLLVSFIALSLVITVFSILLEVPTTTPYSVFNTGDNGYTFIFEKYSLIPLVNISSIDLSNASNVVVIVPLMHGLDNLTSTYLLKLVEKGGEVVVLDENGYINEFLYGVLGLNVGVEKAIIYDDVFNYKGDRSTPLIRIFLGNSSLTCYFHEPSVISVQVSSSDVRVVGISSNYSLRDNDGNGYFNMGDSIGSEPVVVSINYGNGSFIIVSDLDILSNRYVVLGDNEEFFRSLISGKKYVYLLLSGLNASFHDYVKVYVYGFQSRREYWVRVLAELVILLSLVVLFYYGEKSGFWK